MRQKGSSIFNDRLICFLKYDIHLYNIICTVVLEVVTEATAALLVDWGVAMGEGMAGVMEATEEWTATQATKGTARLIPKYLVCIAIGERRQRRALTDRAMRANHWILRNKNNCRRATVILLG
jgi:hypothetical protein